MVPEDDFRAIRHAVLNIEDFQPGVPWHVSGSLLGLDIALASLTLRRLSLDGPVDAPKVSSIDREGTMNLHMRRLPAVFALAAALGASAAVAASSTVAESYRAASRTGARQPTRDCRTTV